MPFTNKARFAAIGLASLIALSCVGSPGPKPSASPRLVAEAGVVSGRLDNGLSYILQHNDDPKGRLLIRLVVRAGALDEAGDESGVAHFVEHMAFNGTTSFPKNELIAYFESIGMDFGDELNAGTSFASTEYELEVPSDDASAIATAFKIAREWADGISFDPEDIAAERGVILEEERSGRSAEDRVWKAMAGAVYGDSGYRKDIIGTVESISSMDEARLRGFYSRYYRPDLMAIVVVGDMPTQAAEALVAAEFASMPARTGTQPVSRDVGPLPGLRVETAFDPELSSSSLEFGARVSNPASLTEYDVIAKYTRNISLSLINDRLAEALRRSGGASASGASVGLLDLGGDDAALSVSVSFAGAGWNEALTFVKDELARIEKYGFSAEELDRVKKGMMTALDESKQNGYSSASLAGRGTDSFLNGSVPISIDDRIKLYRDAFAAYKPAEAARIAGLLLQNESGYAMLSMPDSAGVTASPQALRDAMLSAPAKPSPWKKIASASGLMDALPAVVTPASFAELEGIGLADFSYPNGIRVLLKKTDFEPDEIMLSFMSLGGTDSLSDAEYANIAVATSLIPASGFPGIPADALETLLADKNMELSVFASETRTGMSGYSNRKDMEALFQLARRTLTDPVIDSGYLAMVSKNIAEYAANFKNAPDRVLQAAIATAVFPLRPRYLLFTRQDDVALLEEKAMKDSFDSFFCPPKGGVLVISGSFDIPTARALCDRYFGSLPSGGSPAPKATPPEAKPALGFTERTVMAGVETKAQAVFVFKTPDSGVDLVTVNGLDLLAGSLDRTLRERIREDKGGTYGVSVSAVTDPERGFSMITVSFEADPERVKELMSIVGEEAAALGKGGVPSSVIAEILLAAKRDLAVSARKNGYWAQSLCYAAIRGESLDILGAYEAATTMLDTEWTRTAAIRYLDPANLAVFTLIPARTK